MGSAVSVDGPVLRLTNARVGDRGMYVCDATNVAGQARAATIIDVERECAFLCFYSNKKKFWKNQIFIDVKYTSTSNVSVLFFIIILTRKNSVKFKYLYIWFKDLLNFLAVSLLYHIFIVTIIDVKYTSTSNVSVLFFNFILTKNNSVKIKYLLLPSLMSNIHRRRT